LVIPDCTPQGSKGMSRTEIELRVWAIERVQPSGRAYKVTITPADSGCR
jgi:hypothetical protein